MKKIILMLGILMVFACGTSSWADLMSGSLSTPILYDSTAYGIQPQSARPTVASTPGGLVSTAAWYDFGMRLDWTVTQNTDNTYTYHYLFGPGWYPATNPKATEDGSIQPYVTNKNITAFDIQLGAGITSLSQLTNLTWNIYQFNGPNGSLVGRVGTGTATTYQKCNPTTGAAGAVVNTPLLSIGDLTGEIGYTNQDTLEEFYTTSSLFHGLQWLNPLSNGNWVFSNDITFELTFTSTLAPGLGNFFTNSTRTGGNNNQSDVIAYDSTDTGYSPNMLTGNINLSNAVTVAGGAAPVPIPPSLLLFGSGLSGLFFFRRRKNTA
ncbi:MAG: PEP-CTERM sorting domain-containing protein [Geobacteraceae bacterium]|nr:PEP-CTERM sorting domain-containing protein [Geobacteraceae bacterium]